jgi:hypothetical protein
MVSVASDGTLWQMNTKNGNQYPMFPAHAKTINDVAFSADGRYYPPEPNQCQHPSSSPLQLHGNRA